MRRVIEKYIRTRKIFKKNFEYSIVINFETICVMILLVVENEYLEL